MPNSTVTVTIGSAVFTTDSAAATTAMRAVLPDFVLPNLWGLFYDNDTTVDTGTGSTRTFTFKMTPTIADAAGTAVLSAGDPGGSPVASVTLTNQGGFYARPPLLSFTGPATRPAQAHAVMQVRDVVTIFGGLAYTAATTVTFVGGDLAPGGVVATATPNIALGVITGVTMINLGGPYDSPPRVVVADTGGGAGAILSAGLSVQSIVVDDGGLGYQAAPVVNFTPLFKAEVPDLLPSGASNTAGQAKTMQEYMRTIFQSVLEAPCRITVVVT